MKYAFTSLAILIATLLQAQSKVAAQWNYGVKADVNFSNLRGNGMSSAYTLGAQGGVFVERVFNSSWSVQPELLFTQSNAKKKEPDFSQYYVDSYNIYGATDIKLAFISLPVMFKYNINPNFAFLAGPQYSYMVVDAESLLKSPNENKAFKHSDFSGNLGAQFNTGRVAIYGRYNQGFANVQNIPKDTRYAWRSSHIQLGVAIKLN